jgi:hypothetical protein
MTKRYTTKALAMPKPEQMLNVEFKMAFLTQQWSWEQRSRGAATTSWAVAPTLESEPTHHT